MYPGLFRRACERSSNPLVKTIYNAANVHNLKPKAVAFDLDETLGSFFDLYLIWSNLEEEYKTQPIFNALLNVYPEFLRSDLFCILEFLKTKIENGRCLPIIIYTNNQCEDPFWVEQILTYLESRINATIFARPICAYKINHRRVEPNRTTHEKTYRDFIKCSMLKRTDVCFVDDQTHEKMKQPRVYYIQPPPYFHGLSRHEIIDRIPLTGIHIPQNVFTTVEHPFAYSEKREREITNKMMYYIREFFFVSSKRCITKKTRNHVGGFTRKKR